MQMHVSVAVLALAVASVGEAARVRHDFATTGLTRRHKVWENGPHAAEGLILCDAQINRDTCAEVFGLADENAMISAASVQGSLTNNGEKSHKNNVKNYPTNNGENSRENNGKNSPRKGPFHDSGYVPVDIDYSAKVLIRRIANLFRIYPATHATAGETPEQAEVDESSGAEAADDAELEKAKAALKERRSVKPSLAEESAVDMDSNMDLREASSVDSTLTWKIAPAPAPAPATTTTTTTLTTTTIKTTTKATTTTTSRSTCGDSTTYRDPGFNDLCATWAGFECTEFDFSAQLIANCPKACGKCRALMSQVVSPLTSGTWQEQLAKVNTMAVAYVGRAISKFQAKSADSFVEMWYGSKATTDVVLRERILKVLNGVDALLGNVQYTLGPSKDCSPGEYAYVYSAGYTCSDTDLGTRACKKNTKGQYIVYICDFTLKSDVSVQMETLTHEGSHHATAMTDDVDFGGQTAYGRDVCKALAKADSNKAIQNADNFCYFVQDITDVPR